MKIRKLTFVAMVLMLTSCASTSLSKKEQSNPTAVAEAFLNAVITEDYKSAIALMPTEEAEQLGIESVYDSLRDYHTRLPQSKIHQGLLTTRVKGNRAKSYLASCQWCTVTMDRRNGLWWVVD